MKPHRLLTAAALAAAAIAPGSARAQEPADTFRLEELVVTVNRLPVRREAATAAVAILYGEELRARGVADVAEALRGVPGVTIARSGAVGGLSSLFVRGGESNYVQLLIDGVPQNDPGGALDLAGIGLDDIERIEVVRGPASVLYGSDAVTGVVQLFTRRGAGRTRAEAAVRGGSFGTLEARGSLAGGSPRAGYSLALSRSTTDGHHAFNSGYDNTVATGQLRATPDARTDATLSIRISDGDFHYPTDDAGAVVDRNAHQTTRRLSAALDVGRTLGRRLETRLLLTASRVRLGIDDRPDGPADTIGFYGYASDAVVGRRSADLRANVHLRPGTVLSLGAETRLQTERSSTTSLSQWGPSEGTFAVNRWNRGYYAQAVGAAGRLSTSAGVRLDENEAFGTFTTWRAGATLRLLAATRLRIAAGTAFKEPTFFENYATGFVRGNPDLAPERSLSSEIGAEHELARGRVFLSATWFDQRFRDLILYRAAPPGSGLPDYVNIGAAKAAGLELAARLQPAGGARLGAAYTWLSTRVTAGGAEPGTGAEFETGAPLLRRPTHSASADALLPLPGRGHLGARLAWVGERTDLAFTPTGANQVRLQPYTRLDLSGELRLTNGHGALPATMLTLAIENVTDAHYQEIANYPARGRAVLVGVRGEW